jgi:hypothetical protein
MVPKALKWHSSLHLTRCAPHWFSPRTSGTISPHTHLARLPAHKVGICALSGSTLTHLVSSPCRSSGTAHHHRPRPLRASPTTPVRHPHSVPERGRGTRSPRSPPDGHGGTAQRGTAGDPDATIAGRGALGTRAGALTCHRRPPSLSGGALPPPIATLRWLQLLVFPGDYGGSRDSGDAFTEPDSTARAARPPRPLPPAPAYRPLPPSSRKYRLLSPQTGTDVKE